MEMENKFPPIDYEIARAICCREWGITPDVFEQKIKSNAVSFQQVVASCKVAIFSAQNPEVLEELLYPGRSEWRKEKQNIAKHNFAYKKLEAMERRQKRELEALKKIKGEA